MVGTTILRRGNLIPDFRLESGNRQGLFGPWDYKQRSSLVVLVLHGTRCERCRAVLERMTSLYGEVRAIGAEVLAVLESDVDAVRTLAHDLRTPFPLLADDGGAVRSAYAGASVGLFLVDRYNALFECWVAPDAEALPDAEELRAWLAFLDMQCEECHPPEPWAPEP